MSIKHFAKLVLLVAAGVMFNPAHAQVTVDAPWVRATVAGQKAGGLFMTLHSTAPMRLVSGSTDIAEAVEIHTMSLDGDIMRMRQLTSLMVTPEKPVALVPGGFHLMLMGLKRQINEGDQIPVSLVFESEAGVKSTINIIAPARPLAPRPAPEHVKIH